ncbi:hypothetical protein GCM10011391_19310 [Pullulanibacillus camelliae]|uniref:HTH arsR-type domain-containing protein n=1 Tax=Pullulanibacillus camelliae TaxID=1707096 RepID=A0A8J2W219_9BACL|nr:hypothetical protein GCM10011391_19310 [Pullulanibacillus camelliae]
MKGAPDLLKVAALLSEPSRATILTALLDGRYHPASELAHMARIKPQTASFHLKRLTEANIIKLEQHGRHHYYSLVNHDIANILESLLTLAPPIKIQSFNQASLDKAIRTARTCYDHLAGHLGIKTHSSADS